MDSVPESKERRFNDIYIWERLHRGLLLNCAINRCVTEEESPPKAQVQKDTGTLEESYRSPFGL